MFNEKRKFPRFSSESIVFITKDNSKYTCTLRNISKGGFQTNFLENVDVDDVVDINIQFNNKLFPMKNSNLNYTNINTKAKLLWAVDDYSMGFTFM